MKNGKESDNQAAKGQQMEKEIGNDKILEKPDTKLMTSGFSTSDIRELSDHYSDSDSRKVDVGIFHFHLS